MGYMRKQECSEETKQLIKDGRKKFVRLDEGAILYSIGKITFRQLAADAGAIYHIKKTVLVNTKLVDLIEYDNNTDINTKLSYGKSSALYHVGNPTYPSNLGLPFSISNSSLETSPPTNKMTIDITFP